MLATSTAQAQTSAGTAPLADASVEQLRDLLAGPAAGGSLTRSFRRTAPPSVDGLCPASDNSSGPGATATANSGGQGTRNLVAVPYSGRDAVGTDLAIQFAHNSDKLAPEGQALLGKLAQALNDPAVRGSRFAVAGHTDATGPDAINQELSCARALAAKRFLVGRGVAAERLSAYGFGSSRPLEAGQQASSINRRVELRRAAPGQAPS